MGQYRHVSDLATFARGLKLLSDFYLRRSAELAPLPEPVRPSPRLRSGPWEYSARFQKLAPLRPVPADWEGAGTPEIGHQLSPDGKPVVEWSILLRAARHACTSGVELHHLDEHPGEYIVAELGDGMDMVAFDDAFEAAWERGDVVVQGSKLYIRVDGSPPLN